MRHPAALLLVLPALGLAACGSAGPDSGGGPGTTTSAAARLERQAAAPVAPAALSAIADVAEARRRVGYVQPEALAALLPEEDAAEATERVLGAGAASVPADGEPGRTAVRVGDVTVLRGPAGERELHGAGATARALADATPTRSVIQPISPSAVQSCLGDAAAETLVGSEVLGRATTIGVGLRSSGDVPEGLQVVICVSPRYATQLHGSIRAMERRFGRPDAQDPRAPVIGEEEIGEQEISRGIVPAELVSRTDMLELLEGGDALQSLVPAPPR